MIAPPAVKEHFTPIGAPICISSLLLSAIYPLNADTFFVPAGAVAPSTITALREVV
jgi:hypothetical protein